jgi:ABC-type branched-subunit amino acid transport system substrate-binding protein
LLALALFSPPALARSSYVLGMSAAFTGPNRGVGIELYRGAVAGFFKLNEQGGISGKPVIMETLDDGYQPGPAIGNTIELMKQEQVLCLFQYVGTPTVTRVLPLLKGYTGKRKPLFFPFTGAEPQRHEPYDRYVFNLRASYRQEMAGLVDRFAALGRKRMAVFYQVDAYGRSGWDGAHRALVSHGLEVAGEATYRRGAAFSDSMREQVAILQRSRPDVVLSVGSYAACAAFVRDARDMGLDVPIANVSFVGSENMLGKLLEAGRQNGRDYTRGLVNSQVVPSYEDLTLPAVREYRRMMDSLPAVLPAKVCEDYRTFRYSFTSFEGFLNAKLMIRILERLDQNPELGVVRAAESLKDVDLGIDARVSFGPDRHQGLDRVYFTTVEDGKFVPIRQEQWEAWRK